MSKYRLSLFLVIATFAAGALYWHAKPKSALPASPAIASSESANELPFSLETGAPNSTHPVPGKLSPLQEKAREYLCKQEGCASNPLMASSEQEAIWLITHGYPSPTDLDAWKSLSDDQLGRIAKSGSLAAKAVHGERVAAKGDMHGLSELVEAAEQGSIYANYGTSAIRSRSDMIEGAALLRVAYMLGDRRASDVLYDRFPGLGAMDHYGIDKRAAELYKSYAHEHPAKLRPN